MTHEYNLSGMTCNSCVARVKSELLKLGDVLSADVQLNPQQAIITMNKHISTPVLQQAVSKAGHYTITENMHDTSHSMQEATATDEKTSYYPIFLLFSYIAGVTLLIQAAGGSFNFYHWMMHFMAGFFLVFSFFKLMNLPAFAEAYGTYDVVAKQVPAWGYIYPFVELGLGVAFLTGFSPLLVNVVAFVVMGVSSIGVIRSLLRKTPFQCACLGTVIKLPLSKVTLFEDLLMVAMSGAMILSLL